MYNNYSFCLFCFQILQAIWNQMSNAHLGQGYPGQFPPGHPANLYRMAAPNSNLHSQRSAPQPQPRLSHHETPTLLRPIHKNHGVVLYPRWPERSSFPQARVPQFPQPRMPYMQDHRGVQLPVHYNPNMASAAGGYDMHSLMLGKFPRSKSILNLFQFQT